MIILILNYGSSTLKCSLYSFTQKPSQAVSPLWEGRFEWKNSFDQPVMTVKNNRSVEYTEVINAENRTQALKQLIQTLYEGKGAVLKSLSEIDVIGHRVVHGGSFFTKGVYITPEVKEKILQLSELAPLHNQAALQGIEDMSEFLQGIPQIAVFDTAFHHTLPEAAKIYPGPYAWFEQGIQRYGFHGINFQYCSKRGAELIGKKQSEAKMVICHLGSGASLCAVDKGISVDTTMGFTPLEGLMMDTRSGTIDPGIILHLLKNEKSSEAISQVLYHQSGLLGISGVSSDMRDVIDAHHQGVPRATLALKIYEHRLNALIGSMIAALQGMDALVFTGGIGENAALIRERVCENFAFLGVLLDQSKNEQKENEDRILSKENSPIKVLVVHAQEAFQIACECWDSIKPKGAKV